MKLKLGRLSVLYSAVSLVVFVDLTTISSNAFSTLSIQHCISNNNSNRQCKHPIASGKGIISHHLSAISNDDDFQEKKDGFNTTELTDIISRLKQKEDDNFLAETQATLSQRIKEISRSDSIQQQIDAHNLSQQDFSSPRHSLSLHLPVVCFDAILPQQKMEGKTQDSTFICFLIELGLGGWFVMTSLDVRSRKVRRNGTLCKIELLDTVVKSGSNTRIPTAVDFVISGQKRCRIVGDDVDMKQRLGRWRRSYDDNGEEIVLGWGEERFLDVPVAYIESSSEEDIISKGMIPSSLPCTEWSAIEVECKSDDLNEVTDELVEFGHSLMPLLDEWYDLASNIRTYENINVTCASRVKRGQPFISVQPDNLLRRVKKDLGEMPLITANSIHDFVFWAAALVNPLPALGVSLEIRGKMLEAYGLSDKLKILERGLKRSIQNLKGGRPL